MVEDERRAALAAAQSSSNSRKRSSASQSAASKAAKASAAVTNGKAASGAELHGKLVCMRNCTLPSHAPAYTQMHPHQPCRARFVLLLACSRMLRHRTRMHDDDVVR